MQTLIIRTGCYLLLAAVLAETLRLEVAWLEPQRRFSEFGYTEWLQAAMLLVGTVLLLTRARRLADYTSLAYCLAGAFGVLLIRENDALLELYLPHGIWKYPAGLVMISVVVYFWRHRQNVMAQAVRWSATPSFGVMLAGAAVLGFSRLFGRGEVVWQALMEEQFMRDVKNLAEEGVELMALGLMLAAVVELCFFTARQHRHD